MTLNPVAGSDQLFRKENYIFSFTKQWFHGRLIGIRKENNIIYLTKHGFETMSKRPKYQLQLEKRITDYPYGTAFSASDFLDIGDANTVGQTLFRIEKKG